MECFGLIEGARLVPVTPLGAGNNPGDHQSNGVVCLAYLTKTSLDTRKLSVVLDAMRADSNVFHLSF